MASTQSAPNMAAANGAAPAQGANNLQNMNGDQVKEILTVSHPDSTMSSSPFDIVSYQWVHLTALHVHI